MALQEAVLSICDAMDADAKTMAGTEQARVMGYAFALRTAVKAAEGTGINPITSLVMSSSPESAALQNATMIEQAREEMRKARRGVFYQEQKEARMVSTVGGPEDGTYVPVDPHMPVGARCELSGCVYELRADGFLHAVS